MPLHKCTKTFRSTKFGDVYRIRFEEQANHQYFLYVEKHPHNPIGGSMHDTHILSGNRLCISEPMPNFDRAMAQALNWINYFSNYIRTGNTDQKTIRAHINED